MNRLDELDELLGNYFKNQNSLDVIYDDELKSKLQSWAYETALGCVGEDLPENNAHYSAGLAAQVRNDEKAAIRQALRIKFNQEQS